MDERNYVSRNEFSQLDKRIGQVEVRMTRSETKVEHIESTLQDIKGDTKKIIWLIVSAVVLAVLKLVVVDGGI